MVMAQNTNQPAPFIQSLPYTIHFLDGSTRLVTDGSDPETIIFATASRYTLGPGQHVYVTG